MVSNGASGGGSARRAAASSAAAPAPVASRLPSPRFLLQPCGDLGGRLAQVALQRLLLGSPRAREVGKLALVAALCQLVRAGGCLRERQTEASDRSDGPTYSAEGRKSRPVRFCSRMCADQPATREHANIAGASGGGISATSRTIAE